MLQETLLASLAGLALVVGPGRARPITEAESIVTVYTQDWGLASAGTPKLILAAWSDGYVVWSENRVRGGAPYLAGQVPPARVSTVLDQVERDGAFADKRLGQPCFGPDSSFTTILFKRGDRQIKMESWHELAEADGRVVARSCALTSLSGERRFEVLSKEPAEHLYYRAVWAELRGVASTLISPGSRPVVGDVFIKAGIMSWREASSR